MVTFRGEIKIYIYGSLITWIVIIFAKKKKIGFA